MAIAGLDPSCGAGLWVDGLAITAAGGRPWLVATALTAQGLRGVAAIECVQDLLLERQVDALGAPPDGLKVGMLGTAALVHRVAAMVGDGRLPAPVLDPVLFASTGGPLLDAAGRRALLDTLLPLCAVVTPNAPELAALSGIPVEGDDSVIEAALRLTERGAQAVVAKGGHRRGDVVRDWIVRAGFEPCPLDAARRPGSLRGTGCRHASWLATRLASGSDLRSAAATAQTWVADRMEDP